jgi:ubiquinone/menaquinone biosynthesis C-methylase UbiE
MAAPTNEQLERTWDDFAELFGKVAEWSCNPLAYTLIQSIDVRNLSPNALVVDVGCGTGGGSQICLNAMEQYNSSRARFRAFDISSHMVDYTAKKISKYPNATVTLGNAESLPLPTGRTNFLKSRRNPVTN